MSNKPPAPSCIVCNKLAAGIYTVNRERFPACRACVAAQPGAVLQPYKCSDCGKPAVYQYAYLCPDDIWTVFVPMCQGCCDKDVEQTASKEILLREI